MYKEQSFRNLIDYWGVRAPDKEAIYDGQRRISYGKLQGDIQKLASSLSSMDIKKGDKVMVFIPNWYEFIVLFYALAKTGSIIVPCNCSLKGKELKDRLEMIDPKAVFVSKPSQLIWMQENHETCLLFTTRFKQEGYSSFIDLLELGKADRVEQPDVNPKEDTFAILFTSGSTGNAKGVQLTMQNLFKNAKMMGERLACTTQDIVLSPLPCCHAFGMLAGVIMPFTFGGKLILMEKHSPSQALTLIELEEATIHLGVPTMYFRELEEVHHQQRKIRTLRAGIVAGAYCPTTIIEEFDTKFNCKLINSYGSTEAMMVCMATVDVDPIKLYQSSGRALNGVEISVLADDGSFVGPNITGELLVKGEGLMKGYYKLPHETNKVIDDHGWFYTGDMVTVDSFGYIKIVGRKKNMIIRGGNNIYPAEVEEMYYSHPSVLEVCVLGIPDRELGERTCAYISLKNNKVETQETLRNYAEGKIAKYKIPDKIVLMNSLPKLNNGKIDHRRLLSLSNPITV